MLTVHRLLAIFLLALIPLAANASDEGTVALSEFRLTAANAPPLGHAVVYGSHSYPNFTRLEAEAFGRKFSLTPEQLSKLKGFSPNGAYLSQTTAGYHSPTARLYVVLFRSFLTGKPERRYIVFRADGRIGVGSRP